MHTNQVWVLDGGDRDGNPNVTAKVTKDVSLLSRWMIIDLYIREVDSLKFELSMNWCSDSLSRPAQEILEHESASEDHQSWDHQCYNRNQVKQQPAALPTKLPARADQPPCTECNVGHSHYPRIEMLVILTEDCIGAGIW